MHIWTINDWEKNLADDLNRRKGIRFRYEKSVPREVKDSIDCFAKWLRKEYYFPLRINVYVYGSEYVKAKDGDSVVGIFFEPFSRLEEPYIKISTGDYYILQAKYGHEKAIINILGTLIHEITHYFQWINDIKLTDKGRELQANRYVRFILDEYLTTKNSD